VVIFIFQLATIVTAKTAIPEKTTMGPGGRFRLLESRIPENAAIAPKRALSKEYRRMSELKFFDAIAGTITKNPTSKVPTILMPMATTTDTKKR
jgi:hypothetical protein